MVSGRKKQGFSAYLTQLKLRHIQELIHVKEKATLSKWSASFLKEVRLNNGFSLFEQRVLPFRVELS